MLRPPLFRTSEASASLKPWVGPKNLPWARGAMHTSCLAPWHHLTEMGVRVGDPRLLWTLETWEWFWGAGGQAPLPHKASSAQAFLWSPLVPDGACSERPSFSLCAFKVRSSKSFERHAGATLALGKTPCPPRVSRRPLPQKPPLPLGSWLVNCDSHTVSRQNALGSSCVACPTSWPRLCLPASQEVGARPDSGRHRPWRSAEPGFFSHSHATRIFSVMELDF